MEVESRDHTLAEAPRFVVRRAPVRSMLVWLPEGRTVVAVAAVFAIPVAIVAYAIVVAVFPFARYDDVQSLFLPGLAYLLGFSVFAYVLDRRRVREQPQAECYTDRVMLRDRRGHTSVPPTDIGCVAFRPPDEFIVRYRNRADGSATHRIPVHRTVAEEEFERLTDFLTEVAPLAVRSVVHADEHEYSRPWELAERLPDLRDTTEVIARRTDDDLVVEASADGANWRLVEYAEALSGPSGVNLQWFGVDVVFADGLRLACLTFRGRDRVRVRIGYRHEIDVDAAAEVITLDGEPVGQARSSATAASPSEVTLSFGPPVPTVIAVLGALFLITECRRSHPADAH